MKVSAFVSKLAFTIFCEITAYSTSLPLNVDEPLGMLKTAFGTISALPGPAEVRTQLFAVAFWGIRQD